MPSYVASQLSLAVIPMDVEWSLTASYEARAFGIHSAQSCKVALQLCPEAIFIRPRFDVYKQISQQILAIYRHVTPLVEPLALDEAYLEVSAMVNEDSATQIARNIKQEIVEHTGLTASAGVSYCKFVAKLASAYRKPDGLTVVTPQQAPRFLEALPVGKFFGVGDVTEARLKTLGIPMEKPQADEPGAIAGTVWQTWHLALPVCSRRGSHARYNQSERESRLAKKRHLPMT